ncbi:MAG: S41 family peptidase [Bacteroidota bacterium]
MKILPIVFLICIVAHQSQSQQVKSLTPNELQEDFKVFRGSLEDFHPGLYWYRTPEEVYQLFDSTQATLTGAMTDMEFIRKLAPIVSFIGCGHTWIYPLESNPEKFLPIEMIIHEKKAYCKSNLSEDSLSIKPGDEILAMNGIEIDSLVSLLMTFLPTDGRITSRKSFMVDNYLQNVYTNYFENPDEYVIRIKDGNGIEKDVAIKTLTRKEIEKNSEIRKGESNDPRNLTLEFHQNISTAVLTVKHFFDWKEDGKNIRFESRLQKLFESIDSSEVDNLVIDVRDNGGGKVPWVLVSYFVDGEFVLSKQADFVFSKKSPYYQNQTLHPAMKYLKRKWLHTWLPGSNKMKKQDDASYTLTGLYMTNPYQPTKPQFKGKVYIIANGGSFSATADFVAMMKSKDLATVVGEETGGGYFGNTSMERSFVTLPNSNLRLDIPLVRHQLNVNPIFELGSGTKPDHYVPETLEDKFDRTDSQFEYTLDLIRKQPDSAN